MKLFSLLFKIIIVACLSITALVYIAPAKVLAFAVDSYNSYIGLKLKSQTVQGNQISYLDNENLNKPVVVLVHGFTADKIIWQRLAAKLSNDYRVIALDLLGHGKSDAPLDADYRIPTQASRIHDLLKQLNINEPVHIVGNSMGGHIAGFFAAHYPDITKTVTFLDNGGIMNKTSSSQNLLKGMPQHQFPLIANSIDDMDAILNLTMAHPPSIPTPIKQEIMRQKMQESDVFWQILTPNILTADFTNDATMEKTLRFTDPLEPQLAHIKAPLFVVWGKQDKVIDVSTVDILKTYITPKKIELYDDVGHLAMMEAPDRLASDLIDFFNTAQ